jgi:CubicO group peptidase (beta-lactamase class C family)
MRSIRLVLLLLLVSTALTATVRAADVSWPGTELAGHVRAWFDMLKADDAGARQFLTDHMAVSALAEASVDERLERRRNTLARTGGLTPLEVVDVAPMSMSVRCKAGNGDEVTALFEGEESVPHKLVGVRLEAGPPGQAPPPPATGPPLTDAEAAEKMRATLDQKATAGEFSGVALLTRGNSTLLSDAWGLADRTKRTPMTTDTRLNLGSIGKFFTRTALAQLAEAGKLALDDKLSKYLPGFPHADSITIDMLARHRSGVGDIFNDAYQAMDRSKLRHNHDYLALIRDQPLWFAPGTSERYSNGGYVLLGEVIAKASGEDYYDYLAKHVFGPAAMNSTAYPIEGDGSPKVARGYTRRDSGDGERDNQATRPARGSAAGGGYSTTADLLRFDRTLLGAKLCGPAWSEWVTRGTRPDKSATAGGPPRAPGEAGSGDGFGFAGGAPGIASEWTHEGDVTLIVLTNRDPEVTRGVTQPLRETLWRMTPRPGPSGPGARKRVRS